MIYGIFLPLNFQDFTKFRHYYAVIRDCNKKEAVENDNDRYIDQ